MFKIKNIISQESPCPGAKSLQHCESICPSSCLFSCQPFPIHFYLSINPSIHSSLLPLSVCPSFCWSVYLPMYVTISIILNENFLTKSHFSFTIVVKFKLPSSASKNVALECIVRKPRIQFNTISKKLRYCGRYLEE